MTKDLKAEFWDRLDDVQAGMLRAGENRPVPMSPYADPDQNAIWFITAEGTDVANAAAGGSDVTLQVADPKANIYATIDGFMKVEHNPEKLDELWSVVASAWFKEDRSDPSVRLIRMVPTEADVWATAGAASFIYEVAKANMTESTPDVGEHGTVHFHG
jgi:general stress protein 26